MSTNGKPPTLLPTTVPTLLFEDMISSARFSRAVVVAAMLAGGVKSLQASSLKVYLSAPFSQTAGSNGSSTTGGFAGAATEDFTNTGGTNAGTSGTTGATYTYNSPLLSRNTDGTGSAISPTAQYAAPAGGTTFQVLGNGQFGGGGQGNYLGVYNGGATTLTLSQPAGYFGLEWCAVDAGNSLTLLDQNGLSIGTFNAATFQSLLPSKTSTATITAVNGSKYNVADYFGRPTGTTDTTNRQNGDEQYAFLNFICDPGTKISKITLTEGNSAIFESDNHAILTTAPTVANGTGGSPLVFVSAVPEPSTLSFFAAAGGLMMITIGRRFRRDR